MSMFGCEHTRANTKRQRGWDTGWFDMAKGLAKRTVTLYLDMRAFASSTALSRPSPSFWTVETRRRVSQ